MAEFRKDGTTSESSAEELTPEVAAEGETIAEEGVKPEGKTIPYERFKEVNEKYKALKSQIESLQPKPQEALAEKQAGESDDEWKQRVNFMLAHKEVSPDEANIISRLKQKNQSFEEALSSKEIKEFLSFKREKEQKEQQILNPSAASVPGRQHKPIEEMSKDEFYAYAAEAEKEVARRERI